MAELLQSIQIVPLGPGFGNAASFETIDRKICRGEHLARWRVRTRAAQLRAAKVRAYRYALTPATRSSRVSSASGNVTYSFFR